MKTLGEIFFPVTAAILRDFFYSFLYFPAWADIDVRYVNFTLHIFAKNDHSLFQHLTYTLLFFLKMFFFVVKTLRTL